MGGQTLSSKCISPIYKQIALDIANRIYHGEINPGDKIHGRSTLAGEYNVSPETVRRSIKLLEDMEVVSSNQGSGIVVLSKEKAYIFINRFKDMESLGVLKESVEDLIERREELDNNLRGIIEKIINFSDRLKNVNPINTLEISIAKGGHIIGKTISEAKFWQNTGATIVGIRRNGDLIISPGPYAIFEEGDTILVVGDNIDRAVDRYLKGQ